MSQSIGGGLQTVSGTFTAEGQTSDTLTILGPWRFEFVSGSGTIELQFSPDGGTTWIQDNTEVENVAATLSAAGEISGNARVPALVRVTCTAFTSDIAYALLNVWNGS